MVGYTLWGRYNAGGGKFPLVKVKFAKNHRPIAIDGATYYLRPGAGNRAPIRVGKNLGTAYTALLNAESNPPCRESRAAPVAPALSDGRKSLAVAAQEFLARTEQKRKKVSWKRYTRVVNQFVKNCQKTYLDEITRDDMIAFSKHIDALGLSIATVRSYFIVVVTFLNDVKIKKYVSEENWLTKTDWPKKPQVNNKKYEIYTSAEIAGLLKVANPEEEALIRLLSGSGMRIGEARVAQWKDVNRAEKTITVDFKEEPELNFNPKDDEKRVIGLPDDTLDCLRRFRGTAADDRLLFPAPMSADGGIGTPDMHLDRRLMHAVIAKANKAGYKVKTPKKLNHAYRVFFSTSRCQAGMDIETLRVELGHSDLKTTQIYLRSMDRNSSDYRDKINAANTFVIASGK